jgi:hypothetical protein
MELGSPAATATRVVFAQAASRPRDFGKADTQFGTAIRNHNFRIKLIDDYRQLIEPSRQFSIGEYLHS